LDDGKRRFRVTFEQQFQEIEGSATFAGATVAVRGAKLRGDRIEFALVFDDRNIAEFSGAVSGNTMRAREGASAWTAKRVSSAN
jgi:hypothetical protein